MILVDLYHIELYHVEEEQLSWAKNEIETIA